MRGRTARIRWEKEVVKGGLEKVLMKNRERRFAKEVAKGGP